MINPVTIIMIEDDEGHARLIERNIRRSGVNNEIIPFTNGTDAMKYLFGPDDSGLVAWLGEMRLKEVGRVTTMVRGEQPARGDGVAPFAIVKRNLRLGGQSNALGRDKIILGNIALIEALAEGEHSADLPFPEED